MGSTMRNPTWLIVFLSALAIASGMMWVGLTNRWWIVEKIEVTRHRDIGLGSADYAFDMVKGFSFSRASSINRSVLGPTRSTGPRLETQFWVDPDVTYLWWNGRFIVCYQGISGATPENARTPGWWIIDTVTLSRDGPLDERSLSTKCKALGLEQIQVWPVDAYGRDGRLAPDRRMKTLRIQDFVTSPQRDW
jgi:hypothetical protein